MNAPKLYLVIPCYNEEEVLEDTAGKLKTLMGSLAAEGRVAPDSRVLFVDDGSRDRTWSLIEALHGKDPLYEGLKLAHNAGHQNALWAGMMEVKDRCDALVSIDADLQDDPNAIRGFLDEYRNGCDIVYGVRGERTTDTAFKRVTAQGFYKLLAVMGVETVYNHADYRLMSSRAVNALAEYGEVNLYLRGMVPTLGFKTAEVRYARGERLAGESKYPLKKMLALAGQGITSFSVKPILLIAVIGVILAAIGALLGIAAIIAAAAGKSALVLTILFAAFFTGGLQLAAISLVGVYVGKTYMEAKHRPKYIIEKKLG